MFMSLSDANIACAVAVMTSVVCTSSFALHPDPSLFFLVLPDSQIVAGVAARIDDRNRCNFLFFIRANTLDPADFFSIVLR